MTTMNTTISGYEVELELFEENGEPRSSCIITSRCGEWSSSLGMALDTGTLASTRDERLRGITMSTTARIEDWALANGY